MNGDKGSDSKRTSLDLFVPPEENIAGEAESDDAQSYLERRRQKHKDYLKTAKDAQRSIDYIKKS
jgi:hypothetical protein